MIAQRDLSLISNELLKQNGGRRIPDQTIELDYALSWFLSELAIHDFGKKIAFKGGTALRRCHFGEYRFSEDLDFTLLENAEFDTVRAAFEEIGSAVEEQTGMSIVFAGKDNHEHINSHTFYMSYTGPMRRERSFKVDMTRTEKLVFDLEAKPIIRTYDVFDFPDGRAVQTYALDEVATEKILALTDPARNQPRDLFDIWKLSEDFGLEPEHLASAVAQKLQFRGRGAENLMEAFERKEKALRSTWKTRLDPQMAETPEFEDIYREVKRLFRQSGVFELTEAELKSLATKCPKT